MGNNEMNKLLEIMSQYPEAIKEICSIQSDYWWYMYNTCVKGQLEHVAKELDMVFDDKEMRPSGQIFFRFYKDEWKKDNNMAVIEFGSDRRDRDKDFYVGITSIIRKIDLSSIKYSGGILDIFKDGETAEWWPLGWKTLDEPYSDWSYNSGITIIMKNGEFVKYIEKTLKKILAELDKKGIDLSKAV